MTCPECGKRLEIAVCVGPHPRYREIYLTPARIEYYRERQEQERAARYGKHPLEAGEMGLVK